MSDALPPPSAPHPPVPTPPSIEKAVNDYLDVIHEVRELRGKVDELQGKVRTLQSDVGRSIDIASATKLLLERLARKLGFADA